MALSGKSPGSPVFGSFQLLIWPSDFCTVFEGAVPIGEEYLCPRKAVVFRNPSPTILSERRFPNMVFEHDFLLLSGEIRAPSRGSQFQCLK